MLEVANLYLSLEAMLQRMTCARGTAVPSAELKVTTPIKSSTRALQALLRMALRVARVKLDCAGPIQWRGGAKNSRSIIVICPAITFFVKKVWHLKNNF